MNLLNGARVIDAATGETLTEEMVSSAADALADVPIVFLPISTTVGDIARYLAALRLGRPVVLLDPDADNAHWAERFGTDDVHPDLALLLTTSGSTGNPKLVRLSRRRPALQRRTDRPGPGHHGRRASRSPRCRSSTRTACRC